MIYHMTDKRPSEQKEMPFPAIWNLIAQGEKIFPATYPKIRQKREIFCTMAATKIVLFSVRLFGMFTYSFR